MYLQASETRWTPSLSMEVMKPGSTADGWYERVRCRARSIYEQRRVTGIPGDALSDWLAAEAVVRDEVRTAPEAPDWN